MTLGVANAYLDRSPLLAITASTATSTAPYATHQNLDLSAVYRPFTKAVLTLDGQDTEAPSVVSWPYGKHGAPWPQYPDRQESAPPS